MKPLPAFYASPTCPHSVLWIGRDGVVINGYWTATFNADRSEAWCDWSKFPGRKAGSPKESPHTVWLSSAPASGSYNDVINEFEESKTFKDYELSKH